MSVGENVGLTYFLQRFLLKTQAERREPQKDIVISLFYSKKPKPFKKIESINIIWNRE